MTQLNELITVICFIGFLLVVAFGGLWWLFSDRGKDVM